MVDLVRKCAWRIALVGYRLGYRHKFGIFTLN
jgi:hypothetical protein